MQLSFRQSACWAGINDADLETYLETYRSDITVEDTFQEGDDVLIKLVRKAPMPVAGAASVTRIEECVVNSTKDFWLRSVNVRVAAVAPNVPMTEVPAERTLVGSYLESNGRFYPNAITKVTFAAVPPRDILGTEAVHRWRPEDSDYQPVLTRTVAVLSVELNGQLLDGEFALAFPPGTRYLDKVRDGTFVVEADGTIRDMADVLGAPTLPVGDVRPEDADRILREARRSRMSSGRTDRRLMFGEAVFFACVACGIALARRLRLRK
jgi:hypothetical protein